MDHVKIYVENTNKLQTFLLDMDRFNSLSHNIIKLPRVCNFGFNIKANAHFLQHSLV